MCWNGREKIIVVSYVPISELVILIEPLSKYTILAESGIKFILDHAFHLYICKLDPRFVCVIKTVNWFICAHNYLDRFYTEFFGMKVLSRKDFPEQKYSTAVVGFGPEETHFVIGLTHNRKMAICHKFKQKNNPEILLLIFLPFSCAVVLNWQTMQWTS